MKVLLILAVCGLLFGCAATETPYERFIAKPKSSSLFQEQLPIPYSGKAGQLPPMN